MVFLKNHELNATFVALQAQAIRQQLQREFKCEDQCTCTLYQPRVILSSLWMDQQCVVDRNGLDCSGSPLGIGEVKISNVIFVPFSQPLLPSWQSVVETNMWLFCRIQSNLAPCDSLYAKTPSHTSHLDHHYMPMSQEGIILCAWPVLCICFLRCTPQPSYHRHTHTHTSATEPLCFFCFFLVVLFWVFFPPVTHFCSAWQTRTCAERRPNLQHYTT